MDVGAWLRSLGLGQYESTFRDNEIEADILPDLTDGDLEKLGLPLGPRKRLLKAIASLAEGGAPPARTARQGASQHAPQDAAERRQLTVMFCDLAGSTALSTQLDPEDMRQVIRAYQDVCSGVIARYDGFVAKFMGDGILAYFGFPRAHEDDAERAVRAGLEIVCAVAALDTHAKQKLQVRVGVATGLVVVGDIVGEGAAREQAVVGDTPNLAARLQGLADLGGVVIASTTRRLLRDRFILHDLGRHALKGFAEPIEAWVAEGESSDNRFETAERRTAFVGHDEESTRLRECQRQAWKGAGQVALISGEAGIGKSRLCAWLAEQAANEPHARLHYQCSPYHRDSALHPFGQQLERAAGITSNDSPEAKLGKLEAILHPGTARPQEVVPLIASLLSIPCGDRYPPLALSPAQQRRLTLSALLDQMEGLGRRKPVLILFEDAHWADATSLELLNLAIERIRHLPILLLITFRPEFEAPWQGLADVASFPLGRLDRRQAEAVVEGVTGGRSLPAEVMAQIVAKTDGVPLFVEELTKTVLESGLLVEDGAHFRLAGPLPPLAIPSTLQDSLMARLDRLAPVKEIAQVAAAIGREFSYDLLYAVVGRDDESLRSALAQLEEAELLFRTGTPADLRYSFKHALIQDTAYESLLKSRRQVLHQRIAVTLEQRFVSLTEAEPEILAHHFSRAGLVAEACSYSERAGALALARSAYAEAVSHFEAALAEAGRMPAGTERARRELAILLKLGPAIVVLKGLQPAEVEPLYRRASNVAESLGDEKGLFKALWGLWFSANLSRNTGVARDRAEQLVAIGQRSKDELLLLEAKHCRWSTAFFRGDIGRLLADARDGASEYDLERHRRLADEYGGHDAGVCACTVLGLGLAQYGLPRESRQSVERGVALGEQLNSPPSLTFGCMNAMTAYQIAGDHAAVGRVAERVIGLADRFNLPPQKSIGVFMSGWVRTVEGDIVGGRQIVEQEYPRVSVMGPLPAFYAGLLGSVRLANGDAARALELLETTLGAVKEPGVGFFIPEIHRLRGECLLRLGPGHLNEAVRELQTAVATAEQQQARALQLRAAISLARASEVGLSPLREVVGTFNGDDVPAELAVALELLAR